MAITTTCSGCGKTLAVADEYAGRQARCPACGQIYTVPSANKPSANTPSPFTPIPNTPLPSASSPAAAPTLSDTAYHTPAPLDLGSPIQAPDNSFGPSSPSSSASPTEAAPEQTLNMPAGVQYWMKANTGIEYGPVDTATLARWFTEGRVGQDYQIRLGADGRWQPATAYQSIVTQPLTMSASGANPFAAQSAFTAGVATSRTYEKADQSGLVLAMGILAWIGGCPIFGIIAWVVGAQALADINAGLSDPSNRGVVQVGYYLGMVNVILVVACGALMLLGIALSAI